MDEIGILPQFQGVMCHDHWKPYYRYKSLHALCNAHHLRELIRAYEQDGQVWAETMRVFLLELNQEVGNAGGLLSPERQGMLILNYQAMLKAGEKEDRDLSITTQNKVFFGILRYAKIIRNTSQTIRLDR